MSSLFGIGANGAASFYNGVATQSLKFEEDVGSYLTFTPSSASSSTDRRKVTHSFWVKRGALSSQQALYSANKSGGGDYYLFAFINTDKLRLVLDVDDSNFAYDTSAVFRDTSAWYNIVCIIDTTQSTDTDRVKIYVNGVLQTISNVYGSNVSQNFETYVMDGNEDEVGRFAFTDGSYFDGYMSEVITTIGQDNTISQFGELKNGVWIPIVYSGSYGANGFRLQFDQVGVGTASTSTIGADTSGNNNHWTSANVVASDCAMPDSPENNFCTLNPLAKQSSSTLSEGNLKAYIASGGNSGRTPATFAVQRGKWYWEVRQSSSNRFGMGVFDTDNYVMTNEDGGVDAYEWVHITSDNSGAGMIGNNSSYTTGYGGTAADGQVIMVALDVDNGAIWFGKQGTWYNKGTSDNSATVKAQIEAGTTTNAAFTSVTGSLTPSFMRQTSNDTLTVNFGQDDTFHGGETAAGNTDGNGIGVFQYAPPSGFLALCTSNLPEPTIGPNSVTQADDHFNTVLWTGNATDRDITDVGFQPDWVWTKSRNVANSHYIFDSTRGVLKDLEADNNEAESTTADSLEAFISNGFSLGTDNNVNATGGYTYVAWNWKANGGTTSSNTDGSITSTVQANTTAGFSIVTWTGDGSSGTVGHGLTSAPEFWITKDRASADNWLTFFTIVDGSLDAINLNLTGASSAGSVSLPTSSVFTNDGYTGGQNLISYLFHSVEGYSKMGSYTGNGSTDGTFVFTGFRPQWLIMKQTNASGNWYIWDNTRELVNPVGIYLLANGSNADGSSEASSYFDFLSNGFKLRANNSDFGEGNTSGNSYIYMAFAEAPFKFANAV